MKVATKTILTSASAAVAFLFAGSALAQSAPYECDDRLGMCGTPDQSGGGCGCGCGGSILVANTDDGDTYQSADDYDDDGREDPYDNCWSVVNRDQADNDGDGLGNVCDNCPSAPNPKQEDLDADGLGDACDDDDDNDGVTDGADICPQNPNPSQGDADNDGLGDACDSDADNDGIPNLEDDCPLAEDAASGNCDLDQDGDGIFDLRDKCPLVGDDGRDADGDGLGDACDADQDGDGVPDKGAGIDPDALDNCPDVPNADQEDLDNDHLGEACDDAFCFVLDAVAGVCADPNDPFTVYAGAIRLEEPSEDNSQQPKAEHETDFSTTNGSFSTGSDLRLRLFSNRQNVAIRYTWDVAQAPSGSTASIRNPTGAVNTSSAYEYRYMKDRVVTFVPDKAGTYVVRVRAEQVWDDEVTGQSGASAEAFVTINATGEDTSAGACSISNVGSRQSSVALVLLALAGLLCGAALRCRR